MGWKIVSWRSLTVTTVLSWLMKLLMVWMFAIEIYRGSYLIAFALVLAITVSLTPSIVQRSYNITLPFELDLLITSSLFLHAFFGEWLDFYAKYWLWDKFLHLYGGGVAAILAFVTVYAFHYTRKVRLTLPLIGFFTVTFTLAVGAMWEMFEFTADSLFGTTMQKGLNDTMIDLLNDLLGGIIAAGLGMVYVKYSKPVNRKRLGTSLGEIIGPPRGIERLKKRLGKDSDAVEED